MLVFLRVARAAYLIEEQWLEQLGRVYVEDSSGIFSSNIGGGTTENGSHLSWWNCNE